MNELQEQLNTDYVYAYRETTEGFVKFYKSPNIPRWADKDPEYTLAVTLPQDIADKITAQELQESNVKIIQEIKDKTQKILDLQAVSLGYDNINSIAKFIGYDNQYRLEAEKLGAWTALTWITLEAEQDRIIAEGAAISVENILALIPDYIA